MKDLSGKLAIVIGADKGIGERIAIFCMKELERSGGAMVCPSLAVVLPLLKTFVAD